MHSRPGLSDSVQKHVLWAPGQPPPVCSRSILQCVNDDGRIHPAVRPPCLPPAPSARRPAGPAHRSRVSAITAARLNRILNWPRARPSPVRTMIPYAIATPDRHVDRSFYDSITSGRAGIARPALTWRTTEHCSSLVASLPCYLAARYLAALDMVGPLTRPTRPRAARRRARPTPARGRAWRRTRPQPASS